MRILLMGTALYLLAAGVILLAYGAYTALTTQWATIGLLLGLLGAAYAGGTTYVIASTHGFAQWPPASGTARRVTYLLAPIVLLFARPK